jgi:hypothetical protein
MEIGWPLNLTWYKLLVDQASIIAGILALLAGILAYRAGRRQAKAAEDQTAAVKKQNCQLMRSERRRLASETLIAARLFRGILATVAHNLEAMQGFSTDQRELGMAGTNSIRCSLPALVLDSLLDQLGKLEPETVDYCFLLRTRIDLFRRHTASMKAASLSAELDVIKSTTEYLRNEIDRQAREMEQILAEMSG